MKDFVQLCLVTCLCLVTATDAWLFFRRYPSARSRGKAVSKDCIGKALSGSCDFYRCFEDRLDCGRHWYNVKYGQPYCRDFQAFASKFTQQGQLFIKETEKCMGRELLAWYKRDKVNCHDYTHFAFKALSRCYMRNDFCQVIKNDVFNFVTIYRPQHLFSRGAMKIWKEILRIAYHCEPEVFKGILMNFWESMTE